jgi:uncharacterized protein YdeI (YjbR/CyaY-like superfamily)
MSVPEAIEPLDFKTAAAWRRWLECNHAKSQGEWVYMYKKAAGRAGLRYQEALDEALCLGWIDGQIKAVDGLRFRQRWTPRRPGSVWSQVNKNKVKRLIADGRMAKPGMAAVAAAKKSGRWRAAYSNRRTDEPHPELEAALKVVPAAWDNFRRFAPTYRNMYVGWVADARQAETRRRRIAAVVRRARENRKPGMGSLYR